MRREPKEDFLMQAKRWIAAVLAAALAVMMLAGCDGSSSSSDSGNSSNGNHSSSSSSSGSHDSSSSSSGIFDSTDGNLDVNEVNRMLKAAKSDITCVSSTKMDQFVKKFADEVKATKEEDFSITRFQDEMSQEAGKTWGNTSGRSTWTVGVATALGYQIMGYSTIERSVVESILQWEAGVINPMPKEFDVGGYKVHTQGGPQYWILCFAWDNTSDAPEADSEASR